MSEVETVRAGPGPRAPGTRTVGRTDRGQLPADLLATASRRLGTASAVYLVTYVVAYLTFWFGTPSNVMPIEGHPVAHVGAGLAVVSSVTMLVLVKSRRYSPERLIDFGLVFLVIAAFAIALAEMALPWAPTDIPRGISYIVYWILAFPLLVPTDPSRVLRSALAAAAMGPLALAITVAYGNPVPSPMQWVLLFLPNLLAAAAARIAARTIFQLGTAVEKARLMGNYELVELLGKGGMGEVWRAEHKLLIRPAAVKLVRPAALDPASTVDPKSIGKRFEREAQATALLTSPHTVELYDFGVTADGTLFYAMELLDGMDLDALVTKTGPVPAERAVHLLLQICDSLADAHGRGLIHRDIKPANIFVCRRGVQLDFVKVLDFGLVRSVRADLDTSRLTSDGSMTGTPAFMAPEQALGDREQTIHADIYAIGGVAFWLLTGRFVFDADTAMKMMMAHIQTPPSPPSRVVELPIPASLDALVLDCLAKAPADRPASVAAVAERLVAIRAELAQPWTEADATTWWQTHKPSPRPGVMPSKPRMVDRLRSD